MWDFHDAREKILEVAREANFPGKERVALTQATGRVLARDVVSPIDLPAHDYSAMDGYAVLTSDFLSGGEVTLPVSGECRTGHPGVAVAPGTCARIFTGAALPLGADAVVMQENVTRDGARATFHHTPLPFDHVRRAGEDLRREHIVLQAGTRLSPLHLGLLASAEQTEVTVAMRPRVTIVCTGDELRPPGSASDGLAESNSVGLAASVAAVGALARVAPIVRDDLEAMKDALRAAAASSDVVITVGGVSVGDHDLVVPALTALGGEVHFHKVRIKPGKPVLFANLGQTLVLGLPGNPSSALVTFFLFGVPLLRALMGDGQPVAVVRSARLTQPFAQKPGRRGFYRARIRGDEVSLYDNQASGASTSLGWANALAVIGEEVTSVEAGERVDVVAFSDILT